MQWQLYNGDILDVPADVLICCANVYLTLSGGVGGAFQLRYGPSMQLALFKYLSDRKVRHVERRHSRNAPMWQSVSRCTACSRG
jgi:O-acetyl-ADP-ribose deacetylase (regulator of RNase III)